MKETLSNLLNTDELVPPANSEIVEADNTDIEGVISVQDSLLVDRGDLNQDSRLPEKGFLLYRTTREELEDVISNPENHIFLVIKEDEKVIGYLLSYSLKAWIDAKLAWRDGVVLNKDIPADFLDKNIIYGRQVAILPDKKSNAVPLESRFFDEARRQGYQFVLADILLSPIRNERSLKYHQNARVGFKQIGIVNDGDLVWGLFSKEL